MIAIKNFREVQLALNKEVPYIIGYVNNLTASKYRTSHTKAIDKSSKSEVKFFQRKFHKPQQQ